MDEDISASHRDLHDSPGKQFNINSPQQFGKVLFEDLGLPAPVKYGKGKTISTAADVLEDLAVEHEIARKVLEYRQLTKLKGTYVDALPALIDPRDRPRCTPPSTRPARPPAGSRRRIPICRTFRSAPNWAARSARRSCPRDGWQLIVADYSQIELRLLAHMSRRSGAGGGVPQRRGHSHAHRGRGVRSAAADGDAGDAPQREGGEFRHRVRTDAVRPGAAAWASIARKPKRTSRTYFERYAGVRKFIDKTIAEVRQTRVSRRRCSDASGPFPDMNSRNPNARGFAERTAVNTPLQGTAADLIKLAMIRIDRLLPNNASQTRMLLQVHDELVFESPPEEVDAIRGLVKYEMEQVYPLAVPLVVDIGVGDNWRDSK